MSKKLKKTKVLFKVLLEKEVGIQVKFNLKIIVYITSALSVALLVATLIISTSFVNAMQQQREALLEYRQQNRHLIEENLQLQNKNIQLEEALAQKEVTPGDDGPITVNNQVIPAFPGGRVAYLTFDDGPSASTGKILDILNQYNAKATFFVVGNDNNWAHAAYRRIVAEGHAIGNHTYSHDYLNIYRSTENFMTDFDKLQDHLEAITGVAPTIYRLPTGANTSILKQMYGSQVIKDIQSELTNHSMTSVNWNVDSFDAINNKVTKDDVIEAVLSQATEKEQVIVLMHDSNVKTAAVEALPQVLQGLSDMGFTFKAITQEVINNQASGLFSTHQ